MKAVQVVTALLAVSLHVAGSAQVKGPPPAAKALIDSIQQQARAECREQRGSLRIDGYAVTDADLNGDGVRDYVVDAGAYQCSTAASLYCGTLGCPIDTVVSSGSTFRRIPFVITHSPTIRPTPGGDILEVEVRASDCSPRATRCIRYWRLIGEEYKIFPSLTAARSSVSVTLAKSGGAAAPTQTAVGNLQPGFGLMQLPSGMRVAALNGTGPLRTLSLGCRSGVATMLLATRTPLKPAEVVIQTPTRSFAARPSATPRPDLWEFRLAAPGLLNVLTSPEAGFSVAIGGAPAGSYSLAETTAVRTALAPCSSGIKATETAAEMPRPSAAPAGTVGVMGIPIRHGYFVAIGQQCARASHVYRFDSSGHAEGYASDGTSLTFIRWKRATRQRDGSFEVEFAPQPGDMPGDEITIVVKPLNPDTMDLTIQDTVRLRRCDPAQVPAWARQ